MGMEDSKHGFEEEKAFVDVEVEDKACGKVELKCSIVDIRAEKLKNLITGVIRLDKLKSLMLPKSPGFDQLKLWVLGITIMMLLLWVFALQLATVGKTIGPTTVKFETPPPPRVYKNEGYLMVSSNGGLNQMRTGICDMVAIARFLNLTLVVPELDKTSFWHDSSQFKDIWDVDYFIKSLSNEVRIIKQLPPRLRKKVQRYALYSMPPVSWSNMSYYFNTVFPRFRKYEVVRFTKTDTRLGNNLPVEVQKLRCRVNYEALRFTPAIEEMGKKIIRILRDKGPYLVLHLRYEMDMLAFSGCTEGCNQREVEELTRMRYAFPWWKEKEIDPKSKREAGLCPLTPLETALALRAFDIDPNIQIYIAAGDIYGGKRRLAGLRAFYPNLVKKETLLSPSDLKPFQNHSSQMAALDYLVSLDSDIFLPTYGGNMAKVVEGHRRFLGYKMTISLDRLVLISLIDQYKNGTMSWKEFSQSVKAAHANRMGSPSQRLQFPERIYNYRVEGSVEMDKHTNAGYEGSEFVDKEVKQKYGKMEVNQTAIGGFKAEKMKTMAARQASPLACIKFWVVVVSTMLLILWVGAVQLATLDDKIMVPKSAFYFPYSFPPQRVYKNNGYLIISPNGGLNQKRLGISDMVAIARYFNVTLIVPKFAHGTYWNDTSKFADIFDVNHFITSLRDEVRILKELPPEQKRKAESEPLYYMFPMSFASLEYYYQRVLPRIQKHEILLFAQTDARLANNGLPEELQRLRCRVNYKALRFTQPIEETGRKIVNILREKGPFLVLHLRYEKDVLAFTGCIEGLTKEEAAEVKEMRYSHDGWRHKPIDSKKKRERGSCPLTPEETALVLGALGIDRNTTIYIAAGEIYKKEKRTADLAAAYPNLVRKQTILKPEELEPFLEHADQMAALDYIVAVESDVFVPTFVGNMAKAVEGHRRYLGFKTTISLDRKLLVSLIDQYKNGTLSWDEFSLLVKKTHEDHTGKPEKRKEIPDHPRQEDYFYSNPQECLPPFASTFD